MFPKDPQEPRLVAWIRNPRVRRTLILAILWIFIFAVLITCNFVLLPFGLAVLLAFIIEPIVAFIASKKPFGRPIPRAAAVLAVYLTLFGVFFGAGNWAVGQFGRELARVGAISANLLGEIDPMMQRLLAKTVAFAEENNIPISRQEIEQFFRQNIAAFGEELGHNTAKVLALGREIVGGTVRAIFGLFLVLMLTAFLSIDRDRIQRFFFSLVPPEYQGAYKTVTNTMALGLAGVVRGQVMICLTNGIFTFIGLWILGVKLPLLLGMIATVFSLIPVFGSILSTIPIVAIALTDSLTKGVFALLWIIGIHLLEANLLNPKIMGTAAKIHPVVVVFALIVGEQTAGLIGALFAVPIASVVLTIFKFLHLRALEAEKQRDTAEISAETAREAITAARVLSAPHEPASGPSAPALGSGPAKAGRDGLAATGGTALPGRDPLTGKAPRVEASVGADVPPAPVGE